mgnify:CR=1 FL=1
MLALLVLHRAKLLASNQSILALGVAPRQVAGTPVPVFSPFPGERGQFGKDAEIRTRRALHEAKPSECPKGDRDNKSEVYFKNRLFYNLRRYSLYEYRLNLSINLYNFIKWGLGRSPKRGEGGSPTLSPGTDAGRVCPKALHDAEPTKHTQPFTGERGLGIGIIN